MPDLTPTRRRFLIGAGALLASPQIVRASSLMPVRAWVDAPAERVFRYLGPDRFRVVVGGRDVGPVLPFAYATPRQSVRILMPEPEVMLSLRPGEVCRVGAVSVELGSGPPCCPED